MRYNGGVGWLSPAKETPPTSYKLTLYRRVFTVMEFWNTALGFARQYEAQVLFGLAALVVLLLVLVVCLVRKVGKLGRLGVGAVDGETGRVLREELKDHAKNLSTLSNGLESLQQHQTNLQAQQEACVQRIGYVRFDAFEDVGGEQSFALALLDAKNNGIVISNLFSRVDSRVYAKRINGGRSEHTLSGEEREAVDKAVPL
jgi:hypothetical protein